MPANKRLSVRFTPTLYARLQKWAYSSGRTKAQLIRASVEHCLNIKKIY